MTAEFYYARWFAALESGKRNLAAAIERGVPARLRLEFEDLRDAPANDIDEDARYEQWREDRACADADHAAFGY